MSQPTAAPGQLWVDVSPLLQGRRRWTGIPRTVALLVKEWLGPGGPPLRLCRFRVDRRDARRSCFLEVSPAALGRAFAAATDASPAPAVALPALLARAGRLLTRLARPADMRPGDTLLAMGDGWANPGYCDVVARLRRQRGLRFTALVYDLIPDRFPHFFGPGLAHAYRAWAADTLLLADRVLTISRHSRRDLAAFALGHGIPLPPVDVVRLGDTHPADAPTARPAALPPLEGGPGFVLSVGTLEVRKNHGLLYQLWRRLADEYAGDLPPLVLAGQPGWLSQDVCYQMGHDPAVSGRIILLTDTTDAELRWLYDNCLFTLYPSHYEGWGLPVAESLARGKYCIASGTSSLPEIGGELIDYHDPLDFVGLKALATRALFEARYRQAREEAIRRHYRRTSWRSCASAVRAVVEGCIPSAAAA
jgi:glycosyltransferase involved in cell wall biosynthesis